MHIHSLNDWQHSHHFHADDTHGERNTKRDIFELVPFREIDVGQASEPEGSSSLACPTQ
jgi:hypothetical protein